MGKLLLALIATVSALASLVRVSSTDASGVSSHAVEVLPAPIAEHHEWGRKPEQAGLQKRGLYINTDGPGRHFAFTHHDNSVEIEVKELPGYEFSRKFNVKLVSRAGWYKFLKIMRGDGDIAVGMCSAQDCAEDRPGVSYSDFFDADLVASPTTGQVEIRFYKACFLGAHTHVRSIVRHKTLLYGKSLEVVVRGG